MGQAGRRQTWSVSMRQVCFGLLLSIGIGLVVATVYAQMTSSAKAEKRALLAERWWQ